MPPVYETLLLNTVVPQIQAAQAGDSYVMVVNATTPALRITQTGTGNALEVEDSSNPDATPFVVTAAGDVGIGTNAPAYKLDVRGVAAAGNGTITTGISWDTRGLVGTFTNHGLGFLTNGAVQATLDTSGNLGLGVTPSAWATVVPAMQIGSGGAFIAAQGSASTVRVGANAYYDAGWKYITANAASVYQQLNGEHLWFRSTSTPVIGNDPSFTQAMTLDASGNLGVGTTSPAARLDVFTTGDTMAKFARDLTTDAGLLIRANDDGPFLDTSGVHALRFFTNGAERARITSGGYFKASNDGTYTSSGSFHEVCQSENAAGFAVECSNASLTTYGVAYLEAARNTTDNTFYALSYYNTGAAAYKFRVADSGDVTNTNGTYGTISDQKMKTDIVDAGSQWADIKALRFRKFKMKDDPSGLVQLGVVAQEVELTSPGLVDEHQDRDAEGNDLGTTTKSVKTSVLLMKAAVALQEAMARIETLEAKIAALEAK